mmetsp:Transcript_11868/g.51105  ORF Transcript_11868/g.51105 Transcript_11868/m.51105 type:complete len:310 (+) Transcript_11868:341-1270(+)
MRRRLLQQRGHQSAVKYSVGGSPRCDPAVNHRPELHRVTRQHHRLTIRRDQTKGHEGLGHGRLPSLVDEEVRETSRVCGEVRAQQAGAGARTHHDPRVERGDGLGRDAKLLDVLLYRSGIPPWIVDPHHRAKEVSFESRLVMFEAETGIPKLTLLPELHPLLVDFSPHHLGQRRATGERRHQLGQSTAQDVRREGGWGAEQDSRVRIRLQHRRRRRHHRQRLSRPRRTQHAVRRPDVHPATAVPDATDGRGGAVEHIRDHLPLLRVQRVEHRHRRRRRRRRFSRRLIRREPKPYQRVLHPRLEGLGYLP